jgi:hypothetical protein
LQIIIPSVRLPLEVWLLPWLEFLESMGIKMAMEVTLFFMLPMALLWILKVSFVSRIPIIIEFEK